MDELLARQLVRQLKFLNFWITFFGVLFLVGFIIVGFLIYKTVHEVHTTESSLSSLQQRTEQDLNVQHQLCSTTGSIASLIKNQTSICQ